MTDTDSSILVPLLFSKPGLATVPVMRLSLVHAGGGAPHQSIRRPLEVLDQTHAPASVSTLAACLPRYGRLDHCTASYLFPPRGVDQFVDEFPEGLSHLLAILLGFYALGADATLGGSACAAKLAGWTASTYPDKQGALQSVGHLREKLAAIFAENTELQRLGCTPIAHVLVADADKAAIAQLVGRTPHDMDDRLELRPADLGIEEDDAAGDSDGSTLPVVLTIHFATDFQQALGCVFGHELLARYRRALTIRRMTRSKLVWAAALIILAFAAVFWGSALHPRTLEKVEIVSRTGIQAIDGQGQTIWRREMDIEVVCTRVIAPGTRSAKVVAGLGRPGPATGDLVMFDAHGHELWRAHQPEASPYRPGQSLLLRVRSLYTSDVLPEPGTEVITISIGTWYPCRICIFSESGTLLREMWHPGTIGGMARIQGTRRLAFWGCNNDFRGTPVGDGSNKLPYGVLCVEADQLGGQCPPYMARGCPHAKLCWYKTIAPQGTGVFELNACVDAGPPGACLELRTHSHWYFWFDADGKVLKHATNDPGPNTPTHMVDALATLGE